MMKIKHLMIAIYDIILVIMFIDHVQNANEEFDVKHYRLEHNTKSVTSLTRTRTISTLQCSSLCSTPRTCVGFYFTQRINSCTLYRKSEDEKQLVNIVFIDSAGRNPVNIKHLSSVEKEAARNHGTTEYLSTTEKEERHGCAAPHVENGFGLQKYGEIGESMEYNCKDDYTFCGPHTRNTITCQANGGWSLPPKPCVKNTWRHFKNGPLNIIRLPCPIENKATITIVGKIKPFKYSTRLEITVSGRRFTLQLRFWMKKKDKGNFTVLESRDASGWNILKTLKSSFWIDIDSVTDFIIKGKRNTFEVKIGNSTITNISVKDHSELDKITVNGVLRIHRVTVSY